MKNILSALSNSIHSARRLSCLNGAGHSSHTRRIGSALGAVAVLLLTAVSANWALAADVVWVDDAIPSGASPGGRQETWNWVATNPEPFSGSVAHQSAIAAGTHQHYFHNTHWTNRLAVSAGDTLFAYVYLDPANPPSQVMLEWNDGNWEHRAYWGANSIGWGVNGTNSRRYMGALPPLGQWVRLDVPASQVGLEGRSLSGMAFTLYNGRATWDRAGKAGGVPNVPPTISLASPANNSTFSAPASITLTADAVDPDGSIATVKYYSGSTLIGWSEGGSLTFVWNDVAAGTYSLTAKASDNQGAVTTSAPVNITVTPAANVAPTVSITGPADGSSYTAPASITLSASAADSDGSIASVAFYNGTSLIGTDTSAPYSIAWNSVAAGSYSLTARATDNQGAVTTSAPVTITVNPPANAVPTVSITSPANGSTSVSGQALVIEATAADSDGSIASVAFYANGTLLYNVTGTPYKLTTSLAAGSYSLTAVATDNQGAATTSAPVSITVTPAPNVAPTVSMTGPADGSTYAAPASVSLTAEAADSDGSIVVVEFYNGATLIGSATTPPYATTWSNVPLGNYSVRARAIDDRGGATYSNTIAVNVNAVVASSVYYLYADHLNTPRVITDATNKVVWRWDSDPFGADAANEDPDGDGQKFRYNLRFPGQYYDRETGLHYNYYRDYEPGTGRYVQSDPIGLAGGMNLYGYANQNPLGYSDRLGLAPFSQFPVYGNWCGPGWTGGKLGSFDLNRPYDYAVPVDRLDGCCREHDICYAKCRTTQKCESKEQASCFRECDRTLAMCSGKSNGTWSFKGVIGTFMGLSNPQPEECVCKQ